jgi:hypothetical protein
VSGNFGYDGVLVAGCRDDGAGGLQRDEDSLNRSLFLVGAIILLLGIAGIAVPYFTTQQTKDVADVGPLHVRATEHQTHAIPPLLSEAAVVVGAVLMGVAFVRRS